MCPVGFSQNCLKKVFIYKLKRRSNHDDHRVFRVFFENQIDKLVFAFVERRSYSWNETDTLVFGKVKSYEPIGNRVPLGAGSTNFGRVQS